MAAHKRAARQSHRAKGRSLGFGLGFAVLVSFALAQAPRGQVTDLGVERLVVGDKGYAVTAGAGNVLERFPVEVIGVQWDGGAGFPLVLVRASGPFIEATGGVAAGMSGSPVYIVTEGGDALIGAIGYVFPRADHDLALVTPIGVMRKAVTERMPPFVEVPGVGVAVPAATPILMTGVSARAAQLLGPLVKDTRFELFSAQGGGGVLPPGTPLASELVPGSPLAVSLAWGDVSIQAIGTVTTVEGDQVLAFGHPFLGLGEVAFPIAPAHITAIVPSAEVPFKLANAGTAVLGAIEQDRPGAIAGRLGVAPASVRVELSLVGSGPATTYAFETAADDRLYPNIVGSGVLALLDRYLGATTGGYAEVAWEIGLASGERVNVLEQTNDPDDIAYRAAVLAFSPLAILASNQFSESNVTQVALAIRIDDRQRVASLEEAVAEEPVVTAGENAIVHLRLQPYRQSAIVRNISVPLPADLEGEVTLLIRGGDVARDTGDADVDEQEVDRPRSYRELLDALRQQVQASELVVEVVTPDGKVLRLLRTPFAFVVEGRESLDLTVAAPASAPSEDDAESGGLPPEGGSDE